MNVSYPGVYVHEIANGAHAIDGVATSTEEALHPGVFVEEIPSGTHPIDGVSTTPTERLAPGVFLEEVPGGAHPIDGVPTSTSDATGARAAPAPDWTDANQGDPGVTLVQLFAFLGESLLYRLDQVPERSPLRPLIEAAREDADASVLWRKP